MMKMIVKTCLIIWLTSSLTVFILALRTWQVARRKFLYEFTEEEKKEYYFLYRQDFNLKFLDLLQLLLGSLIMFPIRSASALLNMLSLMCVMMIYSGRCTLDITVNNYNQFLSDEELPPRAKRDLGKQTKARLCLHRVVARHCSMLLYLCGVTRVREFRVVNSDFNFPFTEAKQRIMVEPCSPVREADYKAPVCVISNHVAAVDIIFFIMRLFPSFIAKSNIVNTAIVGPCARALNCVFVNRSNVVDRKKTIRIIGDRQEEIWKQSVTTHTQNDLSDKLRDFMVYSKKYGPLSTSSGHNSAAKDIPSMVIFGEGTTTSGRTILPLKRGAFLGLRPITPCVLVYRCPQVHIAYDVLPLCWLAPLVMSSFYGATLDVYWLNEVLPPAPYLGGDAETRSILFGEEVRNRMARVLEAQQAPNLPRTKYPSDWMGSLGVKKDCLSKLFTAKGSQSIVATTKYAVSLS